MNLQPWLPAQDSPEIPVNENFEALSHMATFAKDPTTTTGLTWGYLGGRWGGFAVTAGTLALPANKTLYVTASRSTGAVSVSDANTAWNNESGHARIYKLITGAATVTAVEDYRAGAGGVHGTTTTEPSGGGGTPVAVVVPVATAAYNVTPGDAGYYLRFTTAGVKTATFDAAASFSVNEEYHVTNRAVSGALTLSGTGVVLNQPKGGTLVLEPGDTVTVKFVGQTEADVLGSTKVAA